MKEETIALIASYWRSKCSYVEKDKRRELTINPQTMKYLICEMLPDFKIHLWELCTISIEQLQELIEHIGMSEYCEAYKNRKSCGIRWKEDKLDLFSVSGVTNHFAIYAKSSHPAKIINWLRLHNFCVDEELEKLNLVLWKELEN